MRRSRAASPAKRGRTDATLWSRPNVITAKPLSSAQSSDRNTVNTLYCHDRAGNGSGRPSAATTRRCGALQSRETRTDWGPALGKALSRHSQASDDRAEHGRGVSIVTYMWSCTLVRVDVDVVMGRGWEMAEMLSEVVDVEGREDLNVERAFKLAQSFTLRMTRNGQASETTASRRTDGLDVTSVERLPRQRLHQSRKTRGLVCVGEELQVPRNADGLMPH